MHDKQKELLSKFDNWIEQEGLDPYDIVYPLFLRAKERAARLEYIQRDYQRPPDKIKINDDNIYCNIWNDNLVLFHSDNDKEFLIEEEKDFFFLKEEPDYNKILEDALSFKKTREDMDRKSEISTLIRRLKDLNISEEDLLKKLREEDRFYNFLISKK